MDYHTRLAVALALCALVFPSTFSAPTIKSSCATPICRKSHDSKLHYEEGKTYTYGFETEVVTQVLGSSDEQSRIKVKGHAVLAAQSSCDLVLTLQQVAIQSPSGQAISRIDAVEGSSVRFAFQDGVVDSVCVSDDDPTWSTNLKRAIVSMIANQAGNAVHDVETIEVDIAGHCPTVYSTSDGKITRTKDLNGCTHREGGFTIFEGVPYNVRSKVNSVPLVNSKMTCEQELRNGVFQTVACVEEHKLVPLTQGQSGAMTVVKSNLHLISANSGLQGAKSSKSNVLSSILFDYSDAQESHKKKSSVTNTEDIMNKICSEVQSGTVSSKVPGLFLQLKKSVKLARKDDLKVLFDSVTTGRLCPNGQEKVQKLYLDALAMSGSDGAIGFMAEVIANDQVEEQTKDMFHVYTSFAQRPGAQALEYMEPLISKSDVEPAFLLTASALAHQYCKMTDDKCGSNNEYYSLVNKIAQHVRVVSDEKATTRVITALLALGNLDQLTPEAVTAITLLLDDKNVSDRIKMHALEAFRRDTCQEQLKKKAQKMFSNSKMTSELRIQAYLAVARCFSDRDVEVVQQVLNNEVSNQVRSFVVSHIENLLETSSPGKQGLKHAVKNIQLPKTGPSDIRKFSRNLEMSLFSPDSNLGVSGESNIIFSQDSYIPRRTTANFTVDAFGRSYNLVELGLYAEDFEHLLEEYFGNNGFFSNAGDMLRDIIKNPENARSSSWRSSRARRDVNVEVNQNEIQALHDRVKIHERFSHDGVGDLYLRVLGTTIMAESFRQSDLSEDSMSSELRRGMGKFVDGAKDHKFDLTEPMLFIDDEIIIPTVAGFPLNLQIQGTSIVSLQMQGNLDLPELFKGNAADMKARVMPSVATLLKAKMSVGSGPIESGIQLEGKIHSASGVDVKVVRDQGKFEVRFNIPQEKIQIIDVRSDIYWIESEEHVEKKTPLKSNVAQKSLVDKECTTALSKMLGMKLCMDAKVPRWSPDAPYFPLSGPAVFAVSLEKSEATMEGYYLKIDTNSADKNSLKLDFVLDTPGSRTNRKISANAQYLNYNSASPKVTFELESPFKKFSFDLEKSNTDSLKGVSLKVMNDENAYSAKAQVKKTTKGGSDFELEPVLQYTLPNASPVNLIEGKVSRSSGNVFSVDLRTGGPLRSAHGKIKGSIQFDRKDTRHADYSANKLELELNEFGKIIVDGAYSTRKALHDLKVNMKYGKEAQHELSVEGKFDQPFEGMSILKGKCRSSRRSFLNFDIDWAFKHTDNLIEHTLHYTRGVDGSPKVSIEQKSNIHIESKKHFDIKNELKFVHPDLKIDMHLKADAKSVPDQERWASLSFSADKHLKASAKYEANGPELANYDIKAILEIVGGKKYEISEDSRKIGSDKRTFKTRLSVHPGFWYEANTDLAYRNEKDDIKADLSTTITSDQMADPVVFRTALKANKETYGGMLKVDAKGHNYVDVSSTYKTAKSQKPASLTGKAFVKEYLDAKVENTWSRPSCVMKMEAKWIPTDRKITLDSDMKNQGDVYNINTDFKWDAERDPSKSANINSVTTLSFSQLLLDSVNHIKIENEESKLSMKGKVGKHIMNGDHSADISFTTPSGKIYSTSLTNSMESKQKLVSSKVQLKVDIPDMHPFQLNVDNKVSNIDRKDKTFEVLTDVKVAYNADKSAHLKAEVSSKIPGNYRAYSAAFEASGTAIPQSVGFQVKTDIKKGHYDMSMSGKHGTKTGDAEMSIDIDKWNPRKRLEITYKVSTNTPIRTWKSVDGNLKYTAFFESWRNFEATEYGTINVNSANNYKWEGLVSNHEGEFKGKVETYESGKQNFGFSVSGKAENQKIAAVMNGMLEGEKADLTLTVGHQFPNFDMSIKGHTPIEQLKTFELKIDHRSNNGGQVYETEVLGKTSDDRVKISNKLEWFPQRKSMDFSLAVDDQPVRSLYWLVNEVQSNKWAMEARGRWGDGGSHIHTSGNLYKSGETFDADVNFDSPALNANKWNMRVSKKYTSGRHALAMSVEGNNEKLAAVSLDYAQKEERSGTQRMYDGSVKVDAKGNMKFNGNFRAEDTTLDKQRDNGEEGRQFSGSIHLTEGRFPMKLSFMAKKSNKENRLQAEMCNDKEKCRKGDVLMRMEKNGKDFEHVLRAVMKNTDGSTMKSIHGVNIKTTATNNCQQFENVAHLILGEEKKNPVGYRVYRDHHREMGVDILLPVRTMSAVLTSEQGDNHDYKADLSFYIDKLRKPERKVSFIAQTVRSHRSADASKGRSAELIFKHPELEQDMKIKSSYYYGGERVLFDFETVLDIFKPGSEIVLATKVLKEPVTEGNLFRSEMSCKSQGQNINLVAKTEFKQDNGQVHAKTKIEYENRDHQKKVSKIEFNAGADRVNFEVSGPESRVMWLATTWEIHNSGMEIRHEYQLPGQEYVRIINSHLVATLPPHATFKTFTSNSKPNEYYEAFAGFKSKKHFLLALYDQHEDRQAVLADFNVALNDSHVLFVKSNWNTQEVKETLKKMEKRVSKTADNFKQMTVETGKEIGEEVKHLVSVMRRSSPTVKNVVKSFNNDMTELKTEMEAHDDTKTLIHFGEMMQDMAEEHMAMVSSMGPMIKRIGVQMQAAWRAMLISVPELYNDLIERFPDVYENIREAFDKIVDAFIDGTKLVLKGGWEVANDVTVFIEKVSPMVVDKLNWLAENSKGFTEMVSKAFTVMSKHVSNFAKSVQSALYDFMETPSVKNFIKEVSVRYKNLLTEFVDNTKEYAETLRTWIMKVLPDNEARDLITAIMDYIEKKAKQTPVDDSSARSDIYEKLMIVFRKMTKDLFSFDFKKGFMLLEVPLPEAINSLFDFGKLFDIKLKLPSPPELSLDVPSYVYGIQESLNQLKSAVSLNDIVPPFDAFGLLIGSQYYRTFDGKFYHFEGNCQYLLTSDFVDRNFSVVVDYDNIGNSVRKSIIVTDYKDVVAIKPDNTIVVNGEPMSVPEDAPTLIGSLKVQSMKNYIIVRGENGFTVGCSLLEDVCAVKIDGFYHGKVMGLLGKYNLEQYDDFSTPDEQIADSAAKMVSSWKIEDQCTEKPITDHGQISASSSQECETAFGKTSPLRPCFGVVDNSEYLQICKNLSVEKGYDSERAVCTAAQGYTKACYFASTHVTSPKMCRHG